jgi:hypothetical protein
MGIIFLKSKKILFYKEVNNRKQIILQKVNNRKQIILQNPLHSWLFLEPPLTFSFL